ncbi:PAS domain S-box protein [Chromatium okenii]|uniref:PAS domain-containing protein n=1 Tax=Chromatium okenii TaxID=61644 RepID=A0A2S7XV09_9GAMM|nr:PAS domain S-box protein [Chromatium okenii]MBV5307815.1 PAS domain S-box protein [Chromatium okenii]PQJ97271.1 hypothetical protein CXB77_02895 [Chromatium okenii]
MPTAAPLDPDAEFCLRQAVKHIFTLARDGIVITDRIPRITAVNPSFTRITGYTEAEARGQNPSILKSGHHPRSFIKKCGTRWRKLDAGAVKCGIGAKLVRNIWSC